MMGIELGIGHIYLWVACTVSALVGLYVLLSVLERRRQGRIERFVEAKLAPRLLAGLNAASRKPLSWCAMLGVAGVMVAFAQPHWGQSMREITKHSRDFVVLLDTSESMRAADPLPSRMERARQEIAALLDKGPADRFALIAFSGAAQLQCPLTLDHGYFRMVLDSVDTDTISKEGTNISYAIEEAINLFQKEDESTGESPKGSRAIILISDGEQLDGDGVEAAKAAADYARVFVLGIGDSNGAEVTPPTATANYAGKLEPHLSKLDEETLKNIAIAGGGAYTRSRADSWDIDQLYDRFNLLSTRDTSSELRMRKVNRYQWPLTVAVLAFAGEGIWLVLMPWLRFWRMRRSKTPTVEGADYA